MIRRSTLGAALILLAGATLHAQNSVPRVARGADPNDWEAHYDAGVTALTHDLAAAESSFVYASRLRPDRAEPLYAQWITFWARDITSFQLYLSGDEKIYREPKVIRVEALRVRALQRNPFVHQGLVMFAYDRLPGRFRDDGLTRGWIALGRAELPRALSIFGNLVDRNTKRYGYLRFVRASAFVNLGRSDSALVEINTLLAQQRAQEAEFLVSEYQSKELLEYAVGLIHLQLGKVAAARDAFGRAVVENAAFAPAHAMLGRMSMGGRNIDGAITDLQLAKEIDPGDAQILLDLGAALLRAKRPDEAMVELKRAVALEPLYAAPHHSLALALESAGDRPGALDALRRFLALAPRADPLRSAAERKALELASPR